MKNLFYFFLSISIITSACKKEEEIDDITEPINNESNSEQIGYFISNTILHKTNDGGLNWTMVQSNSEITFDEAFINFPSENIGYYITDGAGAYRTTDGGENWLNMIDQLFEFTSICFPTNNTGYILNEGGEFFHKSTDGGETWEMVNLYEDVVESVSFPSTNIGFGLNSYGEIFKTTDGGDFWANICDNYDFESINFPSESVGYGFFRDPLEDYYTYKTTDGGTNWILINQGIEFEQIDFLSENIGYGTTGDELYKTTDGGES